MKCVEQCSSDIIAAAVPRLQDNNITLTEDVINNHDIIGFDIDEAYSSKILNKTGCNWWIRGASISEDGEPLNSKDYVNFFGDSYHNKKSYTEPNGIRPAIWINLEQ